MDIYGNITMDALVMEGTTLKAGAVAFVDCIANPISLARMVMEKVSVTDKSCLRTPYFIYNSKGIA